MNTVSQECETTDNDQEDWTNHGKYNITWFQAIVDRVSIISKCPHLLIIYIFAHTFHTFCERIII